MPELHRVLTSLRRLRISLGVLIPPKVFAAGVFIAALTIAPSNASCGPVDAPAAQESGKDAQANIRNRCTDPTFQPARARSIGARDAGYAGIVNEQSGASSSSGLSLARVAFQYFGASSR